MRTEELLPTRDCEACYGPEKVSVRDYTKGCYGAPFQNDHGAKYIEAHKFQNMNNYKVTLLYSHCYVHCELSKWAGNLNCNKNCREL